MLELMLPIESVRQLWKARGLQYFLVYHSQGCLLKDKSQFKINSIKTLKVGVDPINNNFFKISSSCLLPSFLPFFSVWEIIKHRLRLGCNYRCQTKVSFYLQPFAKSAAHLLFSDICRLHPNQFESCYFVCH